VRKITQTILAEGVKAGGKTQRFEEIVKNMLVIDA